MQTAREMCLRYADLERKLGEIDRARSVLAHGSQFCDPRVRPGPEKKHTGCCCLGRANRMTGSCNDAFVLGQTQPGYWQTWNDFEVKHGNEDTFREMLRIKRSVQAQFNTQTDVVAQLLASRNQAPSATMVAGGVSLPMSSISIL